MYLLRHDGDPGSKRVKVLFSMIDDEVIIEYRWVSKERM